MPKFPKLCAPFEAVVFDMDGVILDSEAIVAKSWRLVAEKHNIPDIDSARIACLGLNRDAARVIFLEKYGPDFPYDDYKKEMGVLYMQKFGRNGPPVKSGAREVLQALKAKGIPTALASSTRSQVVLRELEEAGLIPYFDKIICGNMVTHSKPDPEIFLEACRQLNVTPENTFAIEDSYNGIRAAHNGHLRPIMVPDQLPATEEMQELCEVILPDLIAVMKYLLP